MYVSINGCSFRIWLRKKCSRSITRSTTASKEAGDNGVGGGCTRRSAGSGSAFSGCLISEADGWLAEPSCASDQTAQLATMVETRDRKSTRLNSSHVAISYAVFCLKKKNNTTTNITPNNTTAHRTKNKRDAHH